MAMTKTQAAEMLSSDGMQSGPEFDQQAECLAVCYNGLMASGIPYIEIFTYAFKIVNIVRDKSLTWAEKFAAVWALFGKPVPETVKMP